MALAVIGVSVGIVLNMSPDTPVPSSSLQTTTTTPPQTDKSTPMTILSIADGDVFVMRAGGTDWVPATTGMTLQPGDSIKSADESSAVVTFFEGSIIELAGSTQISLSEISVGDSGSTTINLKQDFGETISRVKKLIDQESKYEIETPAAVAAVRGSTMIVTVTEDGTTAVTNVEGDIRIISQGIEVIIPEGMQSTSESGQVPSEPVFSASIITGVQADRSEVRVGDTITYTYSVSNTGNLQIQNVAATDNVAGPPSFSGGDTNGNLYLDPGETWTYIAVHTAAVTDPSSLVNTVTFSVTVNNGTVLVANDSATVSILPNEPPVIVTETLANGGIEIEYSQELAATGGVVPYRWSISAGVLPPGLTLADGVISGTPTAAGTFAITVRLTDNLGATATRDLSINIIEPLQIPMEPIIGGETMAGFSVSLTATGGLAPYTWSISAGVLPPGLTLADGVINGTPTAAGTFTFTVQLTDNLGFTATSDLSIIIIEPLQILMGSVFEGEIEVGFSLLLTAGGGVAPYTWSIYGGLLPDGLTLEGSTISGVPSVTGSFALDILVTDARGATAIASINISITEYQYLDNNVY